MNTLLLAVAVLALAGCATSAPTHSYRAAGQSDAWLINGDFNDASGHIIVRVNGHPVIDDSFGLIYMGEKEFTGQHQGKTVTATCAYVSAGWTRPMQCMVHVNNERATTLRF